MPLEKRAIIYQVAGGDELNKGAMAQLVARFHGMEEVGGSNPPSSTEKSDTRLRVSVFLLIDEAAAGFFFLACLSVWDGFSSASWLLTCSPCNVIGCGEVGL